jgi:hypothetical protein
MMDAAPEQDTGSAEDTSFQDWLEVVQEVRGGRGDAAASALAVQHVATFSKVACLPVNP